MPLVSMRQLLDHAAEHGYALPAFSVNNMEQIHAILEAARDAGSPAILAVSAGGRRYAGEPIMRHMLLGALEMYPEIPIATHQDHGASVSVCVSSIRSGFTSVMMDGSLLEDARTPAPWDHNVAVTAKVAEVAHAVGVSVEGEIGVLGSLATATGEQEDGHGAVGRLTREQLLTDPDEAARFVDLTGVDALAIAIGTSHGAYKFADEPQRDVLAMDRLIEIHRRIPNTHLVMHGSSSVPQRWLEVINENGGELPRTFGVPVEAIQMGIRNGVRKVNIDTDLRLAMTGAIRAHLARNRKNFDPREYLKAALQATRDLCRERYEQFGSAGHAAAIRPIPLDEMARRYVAGELSARLMPAPATASTASPA